MDYHKARMVGPICEICGNVSSAGIHNPAGRTPPMTDLERIAETVMQNVTVTRRTNPATPPGKAWVVVNNEYLVDFSQAIAAIHTLIEEEVNRVIGPNDEPYIWNTPERHVINDGRAIRNDLRAEQRSRLTNQGDNT